MKHIQIGKMSRIKKFKIGRRKFVFVWKYRYSKKNDTFSSLTEWNDWKLGFFFKRNKVVGVKNADDPKNWGSGLVNSYMLGVHLLIFKGWMETSKGGLEIKIQEKKEEKKMKDSYYFEKCATTLIREDKVQKGMSEEDMIIEIYKQAKIDLGLKQARYYVKIDEDFLSDAISEICERLV